jgi:ABC-type antimicrobial peptide transport system ATPase subunit
MICTHPDSGEIELSGEPLATLSTYRREKGRVIFGKHFSCSASLNAELNLGDILHIRWA